MQSAFIRNGIVNFDASVERKIVNLETETPVVVLPSAPTVHSGTTVSLTNQKKEPPPPPPEKQQEIFPWRIHLKHVEPPTIKVTEVNKDVAAVQQPEVIPSWRAELNQKKNPSFSARASSPENFFRGRSRSPTSTTSEPSAPIPGNFGCRAHPQSPPGSPSGDDGARCEVRESVFRPPVPPSTSSTTTSTSFTGSASRSGSIRRNKTT